MEQNMDQEQMDYKKLYEAEREKTEVLVSKIEESEKEIEELNFKLDQYQGQLCLEAGDSPPEGSSFL